MAVISLDMRDSMTPELQKLVKRARNLSPAMRQVEGQVMGHLKRKAWAGSGLKSRSGELYGAIEVWHGKKSAGVAVHKPPGRNLVLPKAVTHMEGRDKHQFRLKPRRKVSAHYRKHHRSGKRHRVSEHMRRNLGGPRGDIPARRFLPDGFSVSDERKIVKILEDYFYV